MVQRLRHGIGIFGLGVSVIVLAQNGGIPPGTTRYRLVVPPGFPQPQIPLDNQLTNEGVSLGQCLFSEKKLSGNNSQSCASCHNPQNAFSDQGKSVSVGIHGTKGTRNAPALINLAYQPRLFWDGRSPSLRNQALAPIQNPVEMDQSLQATVIKLQTDSSYVAQFAKAFGSPGITPQRIGLALEQYETTLLFGSSKFDRVQQRLATFTPQEQRGFQVFTTPFNPRQGQFGGDCVRCHGGPLMSDFKFRNDGLDANPKDLGQGGANGIATDIGKFKTPSVRNVSATGPYMHDGRFVTLEEVVEHYSSGIAQSATLDPGLAREPGGVHLSVSDKAALVAFLKTLTEPQFVKPGSP